jgi:hypothetical protein
MPAPLLLVGPADDEDEAEDEEGCAAEADTSGVEEECFAILRGGAVRGVGVCVSEGDVACGVVASSLFSWHFGKFQNNGSKFRSWKVLAVCLLLASCFLSLPPPRLHFFLVVLALLISVVLLTLVVVGHVIFRCGLYVSCQSLSLRPRVSRSRPPQLFFGSSVCCWCPARVRVQRLLWIVRTRCRFECAMHRMAEEEGSSLAGSIAAGTSLNSLTASTFLPNRYPPLVCVLAVGIYLSYLCVLRGVCVLRV